MSSYLSSLGEALAQNAAVNAQERLIGLNSPKADPSNHTNQLRQWAVQIAREVVAEIQRQAYEDLILKGYVDLKDDDGSDRILTVVTK